MKKFYKHTALQAAAVAAALPQRMPLLQNMANTYTVKPIM